MSKINKSLTNKKQESFQWLRLNELNMLYSEKFTFIKVK